MSAALIDVSDKTDRKELHWISGKKQELEVYRIPLQHLYFNIENGRYADRMLRLRQENKGQAIDARKDKWALEIEKMLAGEHRDTAQDQSAFDKLLKDVREREQLRPGVAKFDGGVIDGNRRLAVLRRLNSKNATTKRFGYLECVILPKDTSHEDLWRIEAGLQLGIDERWDYSPVNELLKIREGIQLYTSLISRGKLPGKTPEQLVAQSIYGRSEAQIEEMSARLRLIDDYLTFIDKRGEYDGVGRNSERFLEANKIVIAAKNHQFDPKKFAKLQGVLFFVIHTQKMDNWELRKIYDAMGGDPRKGGRKPTKNLKALDDFLGGFDDPRVLKDKLTGKASTTLPSKPAQSKAPKKGTKKGAATPPSKTSAKQEKQTTAADTNVDITIERFQRTMESTKTSKPPRQLAEGAKVSLKALAESLGTKSVRDKLDDDLTERASVLETLEAIKTLHGQCVALIRDKKTGATQGQSKSSGKTAK